MALPPPTEPVNADAFLSTWPMGAENCELIGGIPVWYGEFDEDDRRAAERAFPGRTAVLDETGNLELRPRPRDQSRDIGE